MSTLKTGLTVSFGLGDHKPTLLQFLFSLDYRIITLNITHLKFN